MPNHPSNHQERREPTPAKTSWTTIASVVVAVAALGYTIYNNRTNSKIAQETRLSTLEGTVKQLVNTVDNIEQAQLRNTRSIKNNSERITYTQETAEKTKKVIQKELPQIKEVLANVQANQTQ
jgi:peptidoglycan hydrolase CwlO-like protein